VHTLALKKGADLFEKRTGLSGADQVARMVDYANRQLRGSDYKPYYLYRQKYMSGSFENVGWSRDDLDCLYNIYMMEELHTILSLGGGGMNKVNFPDGRLQRFHNPKFPEQYIEQLDSVLRQKEELFALMKGSV
jgi:oxygen-independent coproporphyrinogen-3 oxidase